MTDNGNTNGGSLLWKVLGPILLPAVVTLTAGWFVFQGDNVTKADFAQLAQDVRRIEATQNQQTSSVDAVSFIRIELTNSRVKLEVLQAQLEGLRRNVVDLRFILQKGPGFDARQDIP